MMRLQPPKQLLERYPQRAGNFHYVAQRRVPLSPLDKAHVGSVDTNLMCQPFLRNPALQAKPLDTSTELFKDIVRHPFKGRLAATYGLHTACIRRDKAIW